VLCVVTCRMHSLEQSFSEARVPGGLQYMSVVTHLSTVQIVFMNRFLVEFLDYLAGKAGCWCEGWVASGAPCSNEPASHACWSQGVPAITITTAEGETTCMLSQHQ
jgi:hypothetical protein